MEFLAVAGHNGPPVSPDAPTLFMVGPLPVTNSMVVAWIVLAFIFVVIRLGTRELKLVPSGLQNVIEITVEMLQGATRGLLEPKVVAWVFPLAATYFIFILVSNFTGLLPGIGSIGYGQPAHHGWTSGLPFALDHANIPLFRPPTADANLTIAMSVIFFFASLYWGIRYNGFFGFLKHIFGVKGGVTGWLFFPMAVIFFCVGIIEVVSIVIRPVALSMRLYGNIYGGENVLTIMLGMGPFGWLIAVPFYFLEMIVASVQALVFTMLCIAFTSTLCSPHDEGHDHGSGQH